MTDLRQAKVDKVADYIPPQPVYGDEDADTVLVGWGCTYGQLREATDALREAGHKVAHIHIRHINPFPKDLGGLLKKFKRVIVAELNSGQLRMLLRAKYLVDAKGINKVQGRPFMVSEIVAAVEKELTAK
jgi:2-oxoglutarate ferredoxin oxidoreductase subunit alpha